MRAERLAAVLTAACLVAACASRSAPPAPASPAFPEFMYPAVPQGVGRPDDAARVERGWRFLQANDLQNAGLEFDATVNRAPAFYPARAGSAYVALAGARFDQALGSFDAVLQSAPTYVPALVGRGQTLLAVKRDAAALEAFEAALAVDGSLADVRSRVDVLRFRGLQELIATARAAAGAGRLNEAVTSYERALEASPDSAFLYRELGDVAERQGRIDAALNRFRRAVELDAADAVSLTHIGELLEGRQDFAGAEAAYRRAAALDPSPALSARLAAMGERARDAKLPAQFQAIGASSQIGRGDLAALIGVRLEDVLRLAPAREVVVTDVAGHWAAAWIDAVVRAGVIEPFANHTFQPGSTVTRADLAGAVSRTLILAAAQRPELRPYLIARPAIADVTPGHLSYPAVSAAVSAGVMPLFAGNRFEATRAVSGAEASDVVIRLRDLAR